MLADLISTGVIADAKMAYFDVRPSTHAPTLELRTCDACPIVDDAVLIAGLFRAAVLRGRARASQAGRPFDAGAAAGAPRRDLAGRARRSVRGPARRQPAPRSRGPRPRSVRSLVRRLRPQLEELGDWDEVRELAKTMLARGNSADRQRAAYAERGRLERRGRARRQRDARATPAVPSRPCRRCAATAYRAGDEAVGPEPSAARRPIAT